MLSESERRSLAEIEHQFRLEEPLLDNRLKIGRAAPRPSTVLAILFGAIGTFLLAMGVIGAALGCFGMVSVVLLLRGTTWR
ncbi:DUF3040 domain-containing protein [Umezawaea endophytica]|uniref:DUF3040 domain-containing protein n=1 Tax=Umezawaea endophytica TaxID=1654476 RepID=A0A9X3A5Y4_9PSEU|nr:DUF3040 domain-containing protein [Umezawaea endophytica]MCS7482788.1 DUF3040 domain-containing protein [Umezawaea endophytica]